MVANGVHHHSGTVKKIHTMLCIVWIILMSHHGYRFLMTSFVAWLETLDWMSLMS